MLKIRLSRIGKKHSPYYRVVVTEARSKRNGEMVEYIGHYDPKPENALFEVDKEKLQTWIANGAQPTETVKYLLIKHNYIHKDRKPKKFAKKPGKNKLAATAALAKK
jgi:small subunit ribosomal protein S16